MSAINDNGKRNIIVDDEFINEKLIKDTKTICKMCFEEEAIEGETLCQKCKNTNLDRDTETLDKFIEKIE